MNKRKILRCLLGASIIGTVFSISPVKTLAAWKYDGDSWRYVENNNSATGWNKYNNNWYYFDNDGKMKTGWIKDNGTWYYLNQSGDMKTGWVNDNGTWYYLNESGAMKTGWIKDNESWYYLNESGAMKTGWVKDNNKWYYLADSGQMKTDWVNDKGTWYFLNKDGAMQTGVISVSDKVYYLNENGAMQTGSVVIDGQTYEFNSNGEAVGKIPSVDKEKVFGAAGNDINVSDTGDKSNDKAAETNNESSSHKNHHSSSSNNTSSGSSTEDKDYNLVWEDNFEGDSLDEKSWSREKRDPGWVNNELQEYTGSKENVYVKDGNLVLKAIKSEKDGKPYYTSGKVSTQNKVTFKYGKFEIKAKSPKGQGLWPALWMMPNDEKLYGQWPKCGEIDIMEILGNEPNKVYGTIHYGDPHEEKQGTYTLENGSFADDYHVYGVEWEPGEIRFYVDGILYHKANDWFTMVEGGDEVTYPAPFDQQFYMQCNLAVGGSWPGDPDETTDFDNAEFKVDYIKVYQLDSYDENVKKPEAEEVILRKPDANGNYVINGDFSKDDETWKYLQTLDGEGTSEIADNKITIKTENEGKADYSIQLVQAGIPLQEGVEYRVSFDAKASEDRTMIVDVSGPDRSYVRYFKDTKVDLTTDKKTYSYEFTMEKKDDANGRLEFNLGNQGSLADVEISNVKIEKMGEKVKTENDEKKIMPDGNYVNNGTFDVGEDRMKYWEVERKSDNAKVDVTNSNNSRELRVSVDDENASLEDVIVKQTNLAIKPEKDYVLYFDAYADEDKTIAASVDGISYDAELTNKKKTFKFEFKTGEELQNKDLEFLLGSKGVTFIDNVRIEENSLIRNGSFDSGLVGWEVFADGNISSAVSYGVDSLKEKNAVQLEISNTGDADWKIQLKQGNVKLEEGQKYKLSFDAKSTIGRDIMYAIQRDGSSDNDWTTYSGDGSKAISVGEEFKTYTVGFEMKKPTDAKSIFTISMGAVNGKQITDKHTVTIDNVILEKVDSLDDIPDDTSDVKPAEGPIITNGDFSNGLDGWNPYADPSASAEFNADKGQAKVTVKNTGKDDWNVQLKQENLQLEANKTYKVSFKADSSIDRQIKFAVQKDGSKNGGDWSTYFDPEIKDVTKDGDTYEAEFTMGDKGDNQAVFAISMGAVEGNVITKEHTITISDVKLVEVAEDKMPKDNMDGEDADKKDEAKDQESGEAENTLNEEVQAAKTDDKAEENEAADTDDSSDVNGSADKDDVNEQTAADNTVDQNATVVEKNDDTADIEGEKNQEVIVDKIQNDVVVEESVEEEQV